MRSQLPAWAGVKKFNPALLFKSNEQGGWWDPSDFSTMYQSSIGGSPVTAVGQSVGMILDKRQGLVRGPQASPDPSFDAPANWSLTQPTSGSATISGGSFSFSTLDGTYTGASSNINWSQNVTAGDVWEYVIVISAVTGGGLAVQVGNTQINYTVPGTYSGTIVAGSTVAAGAGAFQVKRAAAVACSATVDFVSFKKVAAGNYRVQSTAGNRPILRQDASGFYYLEYDGVNSWMQTANSVDFSSTDKMTLVAGVTKSSDAARATFTELSNSISANPGAFALEAPTVTLTGFNPVVKGATTTRSTDFAAAAPTSKILTMALNLGGAQALVFRVNAVDASPAGAVDGGNFGNYILYFGRRGGVSFSFNGREYGTIIRGAATSAAQLAAAERWVGARMGLYF